MTIALLSVLGIAAVELCKTRDYQPYYEEKLAAARLAGRCMDVIHQERLRRGHEIDLDLDPAGTGLIGAAVTPITSIAGHLKSKQSSVNPNFAAAVVEMFKRAGLQQGDHVAVGYSGSFPAINIALCAAVETLKLEPIIVSSVAASQYGANFPDFLWIDMERILHQRRLISFRSTATSIGGREDRGLGMSDETRQLVRQSIRRNGLQLIEAGSVAEAVDSRMQIYRRKANGSPIKAYVNVGGGTVSVGRSLGRKLYRLGLNMCTPKDAAGLDCVMTRFANQGTPVIHLVRFQKLAARYGLPVAPTSQPQIGAGSVYVQCRYNRWLAGGVLMMIVAGLWPVVLADLRSRAFNRAQSRDNAMSFQHHTKPQPLVAPTKPRPSVAPNEHDQPETSRPPVAAL